MIDSLKEKVRRNKKKIIFILFLLNTIGFSTFYFYQVTALAAFSINNSAVWRASVSVAVDATLPVNVSFKSYSEKTKSVRWEISQENQSIVRRSDELNFSVLFDRAGVYTVKLFAKGKDEDDTRTKTMTIYFSDLYKKNLIKKIEQFIKNIKSNPSSKSDIESLLAEGYELEFNSADAKGNILSFISSVDWSDYKEFYVDQIVLDDFGKVEQLKMKATKIEVGSSSTPNPPKPVPGGSGESGGSDEPAEPPKGIAEVIFSANVQGEAKVGQSIVLQNQTQNAISYSWDFDGDGVEDSSLRNPTYVYNSPGSYRIKLTAKGADGVTKVKTLKIKITPNFIAILDIPEKTFIDKETQFENRSKGTSFCTWDLNGNGSIDSDSNTPSFAYDQVGKYKIEVKFFDEKRNAIGKRLKYIYVEIPKMELSELFTAIARRGDNIRLDGISGPSADEAQGRIFKQCKSTNIKVFDVDAKGREGYSGEEPRTLQDFVEELYVRKNTEDSKIGDVEVAKIFYDSLLTGKIDKIHIKEKL